MAERSGSLDLEGNNEEDIMVSHSSNPKDARFDQTIGHIEDIIMEQKFQNLLNDFMDRSYSHFENSDENKLIYTTLHKEYLGIIEKFIEDELKARIENFSMDDFMNELNNRRDEMDCEIFDILMTFEDFIEFKQLMLNHKASKEGSVLDLGLCIQSISIDKNKSSSDKKTKKDDKSTKQSTNEMQYTITSTTTTNNNNKKPSSTPLLDNIQIETDDHEQMSTS